MATMTDVKNEDAIVNGSKKLVQLCAMRIATWGGVDHILLRSYAATQAGAEQFCNMMAGNVKTGRCEVVAWFDVSVDGGKTTRVKRTVGMMKMHDRVMAWYETIV